MIKGTIPHKTFKFPVGEMQVALLGVPHNALINSDNISVEFEWESTDDIIELLLYCDAVKKEAGFTLGTLTMPYVPFGRQDRVCNPGESFSLRVFANLINSLNFNEVVVLDPHSDVTPALFNNCTVIPQTEIFERTLWDYDNFYLVSPDAGALKKVHSMAKHSILPGLVGVVECSKIRNIETGEIVKTVAHAGDLDGATCVILDDICDGGRTFIEVAKALAEYPC